jgi:hypothetical protein
MDCKKLFYYHMDKVRGVLDKGSQQHQETAWTPDYSIRDAGIGRHPWAEQQF